MNRHQFQAAARKFRAGKISLNEFTDQVLGAVASDAGASPPTGPVPALPVRDPDTHKGSYGRIAIVAGSRPMAGAAGLTAIAALRSGAGLVTVATAASCQPTVAGFHPAIMTVPLPDDSAGRISIDSLAGLYEHLPAHDCLAIGPGLGASDTLRQLVSEVFRRAAGPVVIDADGLNNLGNDFETADSGYARILTPHPGELGRLVSLSSDDRSHMEDKAAELAAQTGGIVVLKGHRSLIADPTRRQHNETGNAGMATAGSGDVLTGVVAALIGQGLGGWEAAVAGCHVHGAAGDLAAGKLGLPGLVATDIIEALPAALQSIVAG